MNFMLICKVFKKTPILRRTVHEDINEEFEAVSGSDAVNKAKEIIKSKYPVFKELKVKLYLAQVIWESEANKYGSAEFSTMHLNLLG